MTEDFSLQAEVDRLNDDDIEYLRAIEEVRILTEKHFPRTLWIVCKLCAVRFRHRGRKQVLWEKRGWPVPTHCNVCRVRMEKLARFYLWQERQEGILRGRTRGFNPAVDLS